MTTTAGRCRRVYAAGLLVAGMAFATMGAGCTSAPYGSVAEQAQNACRAFGPKTLSGATLGALGGAAGGASLGALAGRGRGALIGAGVGALAGLVGGLMVGHSLDRRDCAAAQQALVQVQYLEIGQTASWREPNTGSEGSYTAVSPEYPAERGGFCRSVRQDTTLHGQQPTTQDLVTCRTADGNYTSISQAAS